MIEVKQQNEQRAKRLEEYKQREEQEVLAKQLKVL